MNKTKFYICPDCKDIVIGTANTKVMCCGRELPALSPSKCDEKHEINVSEIENDYYITFNHEMTKEHYIGFVAYVTFDKVLTVKLYPEQDASVRFPKMNGGKLYFYCNKHGLFEY